MGRVYLYALYQEDEMTEKRFHEIMSSGGFSELFVNGGYMEIYEFLKPHFTKPKLYQQRLQIPEPVRDAGVMKDGQIYYVADILDNDYPYRDYEWDGDKTDYLYLNLGLIYLSPEDAKKRREAMLAVEYE
jgi:hypothetical protein